MSLTMQILVQQAQQLEQQHQGALNLVQQTYGALMLVREQIEMIQKNHEEALKQKLEEEAAKAKETADGKVIEHAEEQAA